MPLIQSSQDHLPFVDPQPPTDALAAARALITSSLDPSAQSTPHPNLPSSRDPTFTSTINTEHALLASGQQRTPGIDLSRYETPSAPSTNALPEWRTALTQASTSSTYLDSRLTNLGLLETYGKNAWLVANSQLEDILRELEKEIEVAKREGEGVESERRGMQEGARGEFEGLEREWRERVGRVIEVQAAAEGVRRDINERRRMAG